VRWRAGSRGHDPTRVEEDEVKSYREEVHPDGQVKRRDTETLRRIELAVLKKCLFPLDPGFRTTLSNRSLRYRAPWRRG